MRWHRTTRFALPLLVVFGSACKDGDAVKDKGDDAEVCDDSTVEWDDAKGIMLTWCLPCHSEFVPEDDRQGAPVDVNFDTYDGAVTWAPRIVARASDAMDMPPAGGITDDQREALREWVECGLPGGTTAEPIYCDGAELLAGDVLSSSLICDGPIEIAGDLTVDDETPLHCVCAIDGDLSIIATSATLDNLASVGGDISVGNSTVSASLPAVTSAGSLTIEGAAGLSTLALPDLSVVSGEVAIVDLPFLDEIRLPELLWVGGSFRIEGFDASLLVIERLNDVGGDFIIRDGPMVVQLRGTRGLDNLGGDFILEDLPVLADVDDFGNLPEVFGSVILRRVGAVSINGFARLIVIGGDLRVEDCPEVSISRGFPDLEDVGGSLVWTSNPALYGWGGLNFLNNVEGDLIIEANALLPSLPPLFELTHVGGDLTIRDNPDLPTSEAQSLALQVVVDGTVTISGNL